MARRPQRHSRPDELTAELRRLVLQFEKQLHRDDLREKVKKLVPVFHRLRDLGSSLIPESEGASARDRILAYFKKYPMTVIDGDELMVISGIGEWARRVRELRVQFGWWIFSGLTLREIAEDATANTEKLSVVDNTNAKDLRPDQYILVKEEEDREAAFRWNVLNELRKKKGSVKGKIIEYLRRNVGKPVSGEELRYLARDTKEWTRRSRELRTEEGWPIATKLSGRPDLPMGVYILEEDRQAEPHDRKIPDDVRVEVLVRDQFKCTECGWDRSQLDRNDPRKLLELHHKKLHRDRGDNTAENLVTLCNVCHDALHRELRTYSTKP